ncbi:MAG: insulinase family protein [Gemmatimonadaceae bacterium]|nr:insulinase family protein [Gemmatimonadaceae bacterium]
MIATPADLARTTGIERTVLPNGLTVLSEFVPGVRSVALGAWVRAASVHEARDVMGVSHLLEHMVFKGTAKRSAAQLAQSLEALGGSLDAFTSREHTSYQARVLDEHLPQAADVLADLVFSPLLRESDLALERKVVLEEIGMMEDAPDDLVFELHNEQLWGAHPFGYSILGTRETVGRMRTDDLRALHAAAYHPGRLVVGAAGNVTHAQLLAQLTEAGWADRPAGATGVPEVATPSLVAPTEERVARDGAQTHLVFGSATIPHRDPRRHALMLIDTVLGGGMSSRLFQRVREELGLAYSVYAFQSFHQHAGSHGVYVATAPETADAAVAAVRTELQKLVDDGIPAAELATAKQQLKGQIVLSLEGVGSRMYRAATFELFGETPTPIDTLLEEIEGLDGGEVHAACQQFFRPEAQTLLRLGPQV